MQIADEDLRDQYERASRLWPFFHAIERAHGLLPFQLFATGSKETNLDPVYTTGKLHRDGHGHGLFGMDDRWHDIPEGFDTDARMQAERAATFLAALRKRYRSWPTAIDFYGPQGGIPRYRIDVLERREFLEATFGRRMSNLPEAPPEEENRSGCCDTCGSMFHATADHADSAAFESAARSSEFPLGYDPGEFDRLTGRKT